jgi:hypothetical protein
MDSVRITAFLLICKRLVDVVPAAQVALSIGSWRTAFRVRVLKATSIEVAQRVEHQAENLRVTGSTPVDATSWLKTNHQGAKASTTEAGGQRLFSSIGCKLATR